MNKIIIALCLFVIGGINAQKKLTIYPEDIAYAENLHKIFPKDSIALIYKTDSVYFDYDNSNHKVMAINVLNENYINISNSREETVFYRIYNSFSEITQFKATYLNHKSKIFWHAKDELLSRGDLFHHDFRVKHGFSTLPSTGSKAYLDLTEEITDIKYFTSLYFQDIYPIEHRKIIFEIPNWLNVELAEFNFEDFNIHKEIEKNASGTKYIYTINNLPARYNEPHMPGTSHYMPHLLIIAKSHHYNGLEETLFSNTQDQYNWYKTLTNQLENNRAIFSEKVHELTSTSKNDEEKIKAIFYWVQDNIRYIAFEDGIAGFKPDEATQVFENRYGDCKGMANLTKQMLIEAGFDARLGWIGTKHLAYSYQTPSLAVDNHMICALKIKDKFIFLDSTEDYNPFGEYADRIQGKEILIEDGDTYILEKIPETDYLNNLNNTVFKLKINNNDLSGNVRKNLQGQSRTSLLQYLSFLRKDHQENFMQSYLQSQNNKSIDVSDVTVSDLQNREIPIEIQYKLSLQNYATAFGDELYVGLEFENLYNTLDFTDRKTDFVLNYKKNIESNVILTIPEGYKVSYLPEDIKVSNPDFEISISFEQKNNTIEYHKTFVFPTGAIHKVNFGYWNEFYMKLINLYQEQLILTKN